jgi:hypothetical protein
MPSTDLAAWRLGAFVIGVAHSPVNRVGAEHVIPLVVQA